MPHPKLGLLTSDRVLLSPWLRGFEVLADLSWNLKRVRRWLREHGAGVVEVKTRGGAVDPDAVQPKLRGPGDAAYVVFILRWDRQLRATICRRLEGV